MRFKEIVLIMNDLVATWDILLTNGKHRIEFEHGTTSGKRIIRLDGRVSILFST